MSARSHLARLHELSCVVCTHMGMTQSTPGVAHHLESVRDEHSDYAAVAMCDSCHKSLHRLSRRGFESRYKLSPIDLLALTIRELDKRGMIGGGK